MSAKRDLAASVYLSEQDIDALFAPITTQIRAIVERHAVETPDGPRITAAARQAILRDVDRLLDTVFPRERGAASMLEALIVARANEARFRPVAAAVKHIRTRLKGEPRLLRKMGDAAAD